MAVSYTESIRLRKTVIKNLYKAIKKTDNRLEISERYLKRVIARKRVVPETSDLLYLEKEVSMVVKLLESYQRIISQGYPA